MKVCRVRGVLQKIKVKSICTERLHDAVDY